MVKVAAQLALLPLAALAVEEALVVQTQARLELLVKEIQAAHLPVLAVTTQRAAAGAQVLLAFLLLQQPHPAEVVEQVFAHQSLDRLYFTQVAVVALLVMGRVLAALEVAAQVQK